MKIQIIDHEAAATGNFRPTDHDSVFIDTESGQVAILQDNDQALLITIE